MFEPFSQNTMMTRMILRCLEEGGFESSKILANINISKDLLMLPDQRLKVEEICTIINKAVILTGDKSLGLRAGSLWPPVSGDIIGNMARNCDTLKEALEKVSAYWITANQTHEITIEVKEETVVFTMSAAPYIKKLLKMDQQLEYLLAQIVTHARHITEPPIYPKEVQFEHSPIGDLSEYEKILMAPTKFNQPFNAVIFDKNILDAKIRKPDRYLLHLFENHAKLLLQNIQKRANFSCQVRTIIANNFYNELPDLNKIAEIMGLSPRVLQQKLRDENTSFLELRNEEFKRLSSHLLHEKKEYSITHISMLLGFSESSAFCRSFKRSFGISPRQFRLTLPKENL